MINASRLLHACLVTILVASAGQLVGGCSGSKPATTRTSADQPITGLAAPDDKARVQDLLARAAKASGADAYRLKLDAAEILIRDKRAAVAKNLLEEINPDALRGNDLGRHSLMTATMAISKGNADKTLQILDNPRLLQIQDSLPVTTQVRLSEQRARALTQQGQHVASAQQRIFIAPLLTDAEQTQKNQRAIWKSLSYLSADELTAQLSRSPSQDYRGWLELMRVYKNTGGGLDSQLTGLNAWLVQWAHHPAAQQLPQDLAIIRDVVAKQPRSIALLLPAGGREKPASDAIRDGFLAAYFQSDRASRPKVTFYDAGAGNNFLTIYQQAVADGAQVIIGPLLKEQLKALQQLPQLPVPTLALNSIDDVQKVPPNLFQFSLSLNEEALQIADIAAGQRFQRAAIFGIRTDWATRAADTFRQRWQQHGGSVIDEIWFDAYGADYASRIENLLAINESRARAKELQRLLGRNVEFEPRRRQDIDVIFFVGKAEQARSIKPMMTYYYADSIPLYATSSIYGGTPDQTRDQDLDGIRFTEIPWVLDDNDAIKQTIVDFSRASAPLQRLNAMGSDAFRLYPRLRQLELFPNAQLQGSTGELSMDKDRVIRRRLAWAEFSGGVVKPAPMAMTTDDDSSLQDAIDANATLEHRDADNW